jgi:hypothetical protein
VLHLYSVIVTLIEPRCLSEAIANAREPLERHAVRDQGFCELRSLALQQVDRDVEVGAAAGAVVDQRPLDRELAARP